MRNRIWQYGVVCGCLALAASPCWAQFGEGRGMGLAVGGQDSVILSQGIPCTINLKDATLGQVVEQIQKTNGEYREKAPDDGIHLVDILIPNELKSLTVGDIVLTNLQAGVILTSISKSTEGAFSIETVGKGQVLILRPVRREVVVKAIRLPWLDTSDLRIGVSAAGMASNTVIGFATPGQPTADTSGTVIEPPPEQKEEAQKELKRQAEERQAQLDSALKEQKEKASQKLEELQRAIVTIFEMHGEISGRQLPPPKMNIQERLGMIMLIGTPESVQIASEIINATNPENHTAAARPGNRLGDVIPMGGMRMGSGDGEMGFVRGSVGGMAPARIQLNEPSDEAFNRARKSPTPKR
jgi:hypothetical protein